MTLSSMFRFLRFALTALVVPLFLFGAEVPPFAKGDRVTFVGDSITHGGAYHANVYLFYATRFPGAPFVMYNCGISGDNSVETNARFETDIAVHRPNVASIMLGMNDAWMACFAEGTTPEDQADCEARAVETYSHEMDTLASTLAQQGCRLIFIKPSIYDNTAELPQAIVVGKNGLIERFGPVIDSLAERYDGTVVDFFSFLTHLNAKVQKDDPTASVIGHDRVHPGAPGHLAMAYAFLKAQGMSAVVSAIEIDAISGEFTRLENCTIEDGAEISRERMTFTGTEGALPFPIAEEQREALAWVPFQEELNQQVFAVRNLKADTSYRLSIDGVAVGTFSADEMSHGINLAEIEATPQYQHALEVKAANDARLETVSALRAISHVRYSMIARLSPQVPESDQEALAAALHEYTEASKGKPWYGYVTMQKNKYLDTVAEEAALKLLEEEQMKRIWEVDKPRAHKWKLERVEL